MIIQPKMKNGQFWYRNDALGVKWAKWKFFDEMTDYEKQEVNLFTPSDKYVLLDKDLKDASQEEIMLQYETLRNQLLADGIKYFLADKSPHGFHIFIPFKDLDKFEDEMIKEVRKVYVSHYNCDPAKISQYGLISIPNKPHFKSGQICGIIENIPGDNELDKKLIFQIEQQLQQKNPNFDTNLQDLDFVYFFEKDPFWLYISTHILPDGESQRNNIVFPNLAIAAAKSGKPQEWVEETIKEVILRNFPGKTYAEFNGWYKKALNGQIKTYNSIQINNWMKGFSEDRKEIYDLKPIVIEQMQKELKTEEDLKKMFFTDKELMSMNLPESKWRVDNWIPDGGLCFVAGKSSSYKSTVCLHIAYAIAHEKMVFNNYKTEKTRVLYLNEEINNRLLKEFVIRVKKGLEITDSEDVMFSTYEKLKIDNIEDMKVLANFINAGNIKVIFFDSFRRFFVGKENDADIMNAIYDNLKYLMKMCENLTIIAIHHHKKENGNEQDPRDMLRGSSDILNMADTVITIRRKTNQNSFLISHTKNRSGEEMPPKLIVLETGENKDKVCFSESTKEVKSQEKVESKPEECAKAIINYIEDRKMSLFKREELHEINKTFAYDIITKALRNLKYEGTLVPVGVGKMVKYSYCFNAVAQQLLE